MATNFHIAVENIEIQDFVHFFSNFVSDIIDQIHCIQFCITVPKFKTVPSNTGDHDGCLYLWSLSCLTVS